MSKIPFENANRLITGSTGPYSTQTQKGRSANAGNEVANLFRRGVNLDNFDVKYAGIDTMHVAGGYDTQGIYHPPVELKTVNTNSALAFSTEALKGYDTNNDGIVYAADFGYPKRTSSNDPNIIGMPAPSAVGTTIDLNSDGKIDAGELTAWQIYQDGMKNLIQPRPGIVDSTQAYMYDKTKLDGKITKEQANMAETHVSQNPNAVKAQLQQIYADNNIAEVKENFTMPPKRRGQYQPNPNPQPIQSSLMQMFQQLMQMLMGSFGGFGGRSIYAPSTNPSDSPLWQDPSINSGIKAPGHTIYDLSGNPVGTTN